MQAARRQDPTPAAVQGWTSGSCIPTSEHHHRSADQEF
jgi:hypothetical protein